MKKFNRIFTIVIDSLGIGEMEDAHLFNDANVDTLGHICDTVPTMQLPTLEKLGLGNLRHFSAIKPVDNPLGYYTRMKEASNGKDTMTGHWEIMGLNVKTPFQTFTETGFPKELIEELEKRTGRKVVGNKSSSGTEILDEFGEHQMKTGDLIVYTSADSVLQISGHEETLGVEELYRCCEIARELTLKPEWKVGRVIARTYIGNKKGEFIRTANRHDYALKPFAPTVLNALDDAGITSIGVGKIYDIFDGEGINETYKSLSSVHGMEQTIELAQKQFTGHVFTNLVDFDALWGHRRDPYGYAQELEKFDKNLAVLIKHLREDDLLIITADHGNDPTAAGSDHTREYVPFIAYSKSFTGNGLLKEADTFANVAATIADNFNVKATENGFSYLPDLK